MLLALAATGLAAADAVDAERRFVLGLNALDRLDWHRAVDELRMAISTRPAEGGLVAIGGYRFHYLPHLYLGLAYLNLGDYEEAYQSLVESRRQGIARRTRLGQTLDRTLDRLAKQVLAEEPVAARAAIAYARDLAALVAHHEPPQPDVSGTCAAHLDQLERTLAQAAEERSITGVFAVRREVRDCIAELARINASSPGPEASPRAGAITFAKAGRFVNAALTGFPGGNEYRPARLQPQEPSLRDSRVCADDPRCWYERSRELANKAGCSPGAIMLLMLALQAEGLDTPAHCQEALKLAAQEYRECGNEREAQKFSDLIDACRDPTSVPSKLASSQGKQRSCAFLFGTRRHHENVVAQRVPDFLDKLVASLRKMDFRVYSFENDFKDKWELLRALDEVRKECTREGRDRLLVYYIGEADDANSNELNLRDGFFSLDDIEQALRPTNQDKLSKILVLLDINVDLKRSFQKEDDWCFDPPRVLPPFLPEVLDLGRTWISVVSGTKASELQSGDGSCFSRRLADVLAFAKASADQPLVAGRLPAALATQADCSLAAPPQVVRRENIFGEFALASGAGGRLEDLQRVKNSVLWFLDVGQNLDAASFSPPYASCDLFSALFEKRPIRGYSVGPLPNSRERP